MSFYHKKIRCARGKYTSFYKKIEKEEKIS